MSKQVAEIRQMRPDRKTSQLTGSCRDSIPTAEASSSPQSYCTSSHYLPPAVPQTPYSDQSPQRHDRACQEVGHSQT